MPGCPGNSIETFYYVTYTVYTLILNLLPFEVTFASHGVRVTLIA